jgi:DNA-binding FadR family transcriptional regulator
MSEPTGPPRIGTAVRRTAKVSEVIAREIVHDVRGLAPATRLPSEAAMLATYRIGRASLREALRILEVQGLIEMRSGPHGGPVVAAADSRHFARMVSLHLHVEGARYRDVIEARLVMEPVMARLAAERPDHASLAPLLSFMAAPPEALQDRDLHEATEFHTMLSGVSSNRVLDLMGRALKDIYLDRLEGLVFPIGLRRRVHDDHLAIARAILAGRAKEAERRMHAHMEELVEHSIARDPAVADDIVDWR